MLTNHRLQISSFGGEELTTVICMGQEQQVLYDLDHGAQLFPLLNIQPHQQLLQSDPQLLFISHGLLLSVIKLSFKAHSDPH